jgi:biotin transporter BioY
MNSTILTFILSFLFGMTVTGIILQFNDSSDWVKLNMARVIIGSLIILVILLVLMNICII